MFVIGFSKDLRPRRFTQHARFYLLPKLPFATLRYALIATAGLGLAVWMVLTKGVDVLLAQSPYEGFAAGMAKLLVRLLGRRIVLVVESHGDFEGSLFLQRRVFFARLYMWLMSRVAGFSLRHADLLRAVSRSTSEQLQDWAPGKYLIEFPAWTDLDVFLKVGDKHQSTSPSSILFAGALIPRKGVEFLLQAFESVVKELPQAQLWIVGKASYPAYASELKARVKLSKLEPQVLFIDEVSQPELAGYMARACVLVLPSVSEGLGRVLIEGMATATPVVASDIGGIPELVDEGVTGFLVPHGDAERLATRILWLLTHPAEATAMGNRAREFAQNYFSTESYIECYSKLFAEAETWLLRHS